jgi:hypothetical protein
MGIDVPVYSMGGGRLTTLLMFSSLATEGAEGWESLSRSWLKMKVKPDINIIAINRGKIKFLYRFTIIHPPAILRAKFNL